MPVGSCVALLVMANICVIDVSSITFDRKSDPYDPKPSLEIDPYPVIKGVGFEVRPFTSADNFTRLNADRAKKACEGDKCVLFNRRCVPHDKKRNWTVCDIAFRFPLDEFDSTLWFFYDNKVGFKKAAANLAFVDHGNVDQVIPFDRIE